MLILVLAVTGFRSAVADWYHVPTGSMKPTILECERVFVNKLAYDLKVPFTTWHLAEWGDPQRGDITVFYSPVNGQRLVKRVIGLPGDEVALVNGRLSINGQPVVYEDAPPTVAAQIPLPERRAHDFARELLPGRPHPVMGSPALPALRTFEAKVPAGQYFMLGDNRDNSLDSRYFGSVKREQIIGKAKAVVLSFDRDRHYLPRWGRCLNALE
jgi:signal peptidase I